MKKLMILCAALIATVIVFNSCQKDEVISTGIPVLKSVITGDINVDFPDKVYTETDAQITFSGCDDVVLYKVPEGEDCATYEPLDEDKLGSYVCDPLEIDPVPSTVDLYFADEEVGVHTYKAVLFDGACDCEPTVNYVCFEIQVCREETAFGGDTREDIKGGWMYTYTPVLETPEVGDPYYLPQLVYADAGDPLDVTEVGSVQLSADGITLVIDLLDCWQLRADCEEPVKVYWFTGDYNKNKRPNGKEYQQKVYSEDDGLITVSVEDAPEGASFVVHLCVESCELCAD